MTALSSQSVQNTAKCPHGFPVGTCPMCAGMGGGGTKNRDKPRKAGEMSYNECLAVWHKMQAQKQAKNQAKIQAQLARMQNSKDISFQSRLQSGLDKIQKNFDKLSQNLDKLPTLIKAPAKFILNNIVRPVMNFVFKMLPIATKNIQAFFNSAINFINSVTEKLAMIYGEIKNFADNAFINKTKKTLKTLLSLFTEEEKEEASEEAEKIKAREIKKILKGLLRLKKYPKKEQDVEDKLAEHI